MYFEHNSLFIALQHFIVPNTQHYSAVSPTPQLPQLPSISKFLRMELSQATSVLPPCVCTKAEMWPRASHWPLQGSFFNCHSVSLGLNCFGTAIQCSLPGARDYGKHGRFLSLRVSISGPNGSCCSYSSETISHTKTSLADAKPM